MTVARPKYQYRVTKYNPDNRNPTGAYMLDEWTSFSDVGRTFAGVRRELPEYEKVEKAYISSAVFFLNESGLGSLVVSGLEAKKSKESEELTEKTSLDSMETIQRTIRRMNRPGFAGDRIL